MIFANPVNFIKPDHQYPIITLWFDDGRRTDYTEAYSYLQSKGQYYGTSFLNTKHVDTDTSPYGAHIKRKQIREMEVAGWDFQCHTHTHWDLTTLTEAEIRSEMELVNKYFRKYGLPVPHIIQPPNTSVNEEVLAVLRDYRELVMEDAIANIYGLIELGIPHITMRADIQSQTRMNSVKALIDQVANGDYTWGLLSGHGIYDDPEIGHAYKTAYFQEMVDYIIDKGLPIVSVSKGFRLMKAWTFRWQ